MYLTVLLPRQLLLSSVFELELAIEVAEKKKKKSPNKWQNCVHLRDTQADSYINVQHWLDFRAYADTSVRNKFAVRLVGALNGISLKSGGENKFCCVRGKIC